MYPLYSLNQLGSAVRGFWGPHMLQMARIQKLDLENSLSNTATARHYKIRSSLGFCELLPNACWLPMRRYQSLRAPRTLAAGANESRGTACSSQVNFGEARIQEHRAEPSPRPEEVPPRVIVHLCLHLWNKFCIFKDPD